MKPKSSCPAAILRRGIHQPRYTCIILQPSAYHKGIWGKPNKVWYLYIQSQGYAKNNQMTIYISSQNEVSSNKATRSRPQGAQQLDQEQQIDHKINISTVLCNGPKIC